MYNNNKMCYLEVKHTLKRTLIINVPVMYYYFASSDQFQKINMWVM